MLIHHILLLSHHKRYIFQQDICGILYSLYMKSCFQVHLPLNMQVILYMMVLIRLE